MVGVAEAAEEEEDVFEDTDEDFEGDADEADDLDADETAEDETGLEADTELEGNDGPLPLTRE